MKFKVKDKISENLIETGRVALNVKAKFWTF